MNSNGGTRKAPGKDGVVYKVGTAIGKCLSFTLGVTMAFLLLVLSIAISRLAWDASTWMLERLP